MTTRCLTTVWWHDVEMRARCVRPDGHTDHHRDGVKWFDDYGLQVPSGSQRGDLHPSRGSAAGFRDHNGTRVVADRFPALLRQRRGIA